MKKLISAILSLVMCLSLFQISASLVFAKETEEKYSVTIYEDSTKSKILFERYNMAPGTPSSAHSA